jgi:hypothetical protein
MVMLLFLVISASALEEHCEGVEEDFQAAVSRLVSAPNQDIEDLRVKEQMRTA